MKISSLCCRFQPMEPCYLLQERTSCGAHPTGWFGGLTRDGQLYQTDLGTVHRPEQLPEPSYSWHLLRVEPSKDEWRQLCSRTAALLRDGQLRKLVLTQRRYYQQEGSAALIWPALPKLVSADNISFAFRSDDGMYFGMSPEILFRRSGQQIRTEAVSGTLPMQGYSEAKIFQELLSDPCKTQELAITVEGICSSLAAAGAQQIQLGEISWRRAGHLIHLKRRITAFMQTPDDVALLHQLHPSPAVCGWPKEQSKSWRHTLEGVINNWYAGAVGWSSQRSACFWVVLRAGAIRDRVAEVTCGIGLVPGFCPDAEWSELAMKHGAWLALQS